MTRVLYSVNYRFGNVVLTWRGGRSPARPWADAGDWPVAAPGNPPSFSTISAPSGLLSPSLLVCPLPGVDAGGKKPCSQNAPSARLYPPAIDEMRLVNQEHTAGI